MATITYTVTVATGTNQYSAGANKFYINGEVSPVLELQEGILTSLIKMIIVIQVTL